MTTDSTPDIKFLLENGVNPDLPLSSFETTPLMSALENGRYDVAKLLLLHGVNIYAKPIYGYTSLHYLSKTTKNLNEIDVKTQIELAEKFIADGVDVNAPFTAGKYAKLYLAVAKENVLLIKLLLDSGANPKLKTENGESALSKAIKLKRKDIQNLLIEHGATV